MIWRNSSRHQQSNIPLMLTSGKSGFRERGRWRRWLCDGEGGQGGDKRKREGQERRMVDVGVDLKKLKEEKKKKLKRGSREEKGWAPLLLCSGSRGRGRRQNWKKLKGERRKRGNGLALMYKMLTTSEMKEFHEESQQKNVTTLKVCSPECACLC